MGLVQGAAEGPHLYQALFGHSNLNQCLAPTSVLSLLRLWKQASDCLRLHLRTDCLARNFDPVN